MAVESPRKLLPDAKELLEARLNAAATSSICATVKALHGWQAALDATRRTRAVAEAREFFARGAEHKRAIDYSQSPAFRGYMAVGVENTAGRCDHREQLEIAAEGAPPPPAAWPPYTFAL